MAAITILHVSDVHFGERDRLGHQPEICNRLLEKAHQEGTTGFTPDLCIFSGDLTFQGAKDEFKRGEDWLTSLVNLWPNCRLFVVPGNHEIVRPTDDDANAARDFLHGSDNRGLSQITYNGRRPNLSKGWPNLLSSFTQWHESARTAQLPHLVSDWSADLYGCKWEGSLNDLPVRIVGLNTALLSCENNEQNKLVADIKYCNEALFNLNSETTLCLVVAHHPWSARNYSGKTEYWFVDWNRKNIEARLLQQTGAHLYLHGHVHKAQAESFTNSLGQHLVVLGAGAIHQDPQYPLRFALYRIDCNNQEIQPNTFQYSHATGKWERDEALSKPFRAILPRVGPRYPSSRRGDNFDDFGYEILAVLHELSKKLDALSKEAYDLIYRPDKPSDFAKAFTEYGQAYDFYIEPLKQSFSIRKDIVSGNIADLSRYAPRYNGPSGHSSNEHLAHLCSQIELFTNCHNTILTYIRDRAILLYIRDKRNSDSYTDLYAKIKLTKGECDNAITHGIAFTRSFFSFRLNVLEH